MDLILNRVNAYSICNHNYIFPLLTYLIKKADDPVRKVG